jgi:hypothetical protein
MGQKGNCRTPLMNGYGTSYQLRNNQKTFKPPNSGVYATIECGSHGP